MCDCPQLAEAVSTKRWQLLLFSYLVYQLLHLEPDVFQVLI